MTESSAAAPERVWVFNGSHARFPGGVFSSRSAAEAWISDNRLTGTLTAYPLDLGAYHWAVDAGVFTPKSDKHRSPEFIASFSSAFQEHGHYEDGVKKA